jgi:hypothetical protein
VNQEENERQHQPERRERKQESLKEVAHHSSVRTRSPLQRLSCYSLFSQH